MFKMKTITLSLLALLLVMSFASCASDTTSDLPMPNKDMKTYLQVRVTVDGSGDTRASRAGEDDKYHLQRILLVERMVMVMIWVKLMSEPLPT